MGWVPCERQTKLKWGPRIKRKKMRVWACEYTASFLLLLPPHPTPPPHRLSSAAAINKLVMSPKVPILSLCIQLACCIDLYFFKGGEDVIL